MLALLMWHMGNLNCKVRVGLARLCSMVIDVKKQSSLCLGLGSLEDL